MTFKKRPEMKPANVRAFGYVEHPDLGRGLHLPTDVFSRGWLLPEYNTSPLEMY